MNSLSHQEHAAAAIALDLLMERGPMYEASLRMQVNASIKGMARLNTQVFRELMAMLETEGKLRRNVTITREESDYKDDRLFVSVTYGLPKEEEAMDADALSIAH